MVSRGDVKQYLHDSYPSLYEKVRRVYHLRHPQVSQPPASSRTVVDCLARTEIMLPESLPHARRCIATVATPGYAHLLDDMLGSLHANGACPDAIVVLFSVDDAADS